MFRPPYGGRKPVYVLTSSATFSGGEELTSFQTAYREIRRNSKPDGTYHGITLLARALGAVWTGGRADRARVYEVAHAA